ncbi:hypothetical protein, partial [Mesorhizobium sp. M4B.F.Ca.ET.089.01.1.1]|uniref:hypothetical protein n=1 Tax=Mesorhizobium sp. M4B.F.Ca.ET.089.01.1.1 TaxID=2496662 RepID=UPI0016741B07
DFFRGTTAGADATDPTINGTAGNMSASEYLSFDGGDYLTYDAANETWMNNLHKDNAKWTLAAWVWYAAAGSAGFLGTNNNSASSIGSSTGMSSGGKLFTSVTNGSGTNAMQNISATSIPTGSWAFLASSVDEAVGAGGHILGINSTFETFASTFTSPSASNAAFTMQIGARGNGAVPVPNTSRIACVAMWEGRALTQAELLSLFNATRGRFGV